MMNLAAERHRAIANWLVHCADPLVPRTQQPSSPLSPHEAHELVVLAEQHGVLAALIQNFPPFAQEEDAFAGIRADAGRRHRSALMFSTLLRHRADELMSVAGDLPATIIKGPVFARLLYPMESLRPYGDIDVLAHPAAVPRLAACLHALGFYLAEENASQTEAKWVHVGDMLLMVEVQTDLVHAPGLMRALSLTYRDIAQIAGTPAVQLVIAVIHASLGKHYTKLGQLVDVCQGARCLQGHGDERLFEALVTRTGAGLAARTALSLAGRMFNEERCLDIASLIQPVRFERMARHLIDPSIIVSTSRRKRLSHTLRRQAFRYLLKHPAPLAKARRAS